jgi:hypothetical protein
MPIVFFENTKARSLLHLRSHSPKIQEIWIGIVILARLGYLALLQSDNGAWAAAEKTSSVCPGIFTSEPASPPFLACCPILANNPTSGLVFFVEDAKSGAIEKRHAAIAQSRRMPPVFTGTTILPRLGGKAPWTRQQLTAKH